VTISSDRLADAWLRLKWANRVGQEFSETAKWFNEVGAYAVHVQRQGDRWLASWHRFIDPDEEAAKFEDLARLLGSFLDHGRAALNYAAYQLALKTLQDDEALEGQLRPEAVEFPIFRDPKLFRDKNRIKKLPEHVRRALEDVQPYDGRNPGLWMLHSLAGEFRHRVVHPTAILPAETIYHVVVNGQLVEPRDLEIIEHERLEHGDAVMRFSLDTDDPNPDVHPRVAITVGVDHPLCRNLVGVNVLNLIRQDAQAALDVVDTLLRAGTDAA
jgi:hypothetical protein